MRKYRGDQVSGAPLCGFSRALLIVYLKKEFKSQRLIKMLVIHRPYNTVKILFVKMTVI